MAENIKVITAEILDDEVVLTLQELSHACHIQENLIIELVEYGFVEPVGPEPSQWQFDIQAFYRLQKAARLKHDFDLDVNALSLVVELLDELHELRYRINLLEQHPNKK